MSSCAGESQENTHYKLALAGKVAVANADEGVVVAALAESRTVYVGREPAYGREDARIECRLDVGLFHQFNVGIRRYRMTLRTRNA